MFFFALMLTTITFMTDLLIRPDVSITLFVHHLVSIFIFTAFATDTQSNQGFSFLINSTPEHPNSWIAVLIIGTTMGMFASCSLLTDMTVFHYHLMKETHPLRVYRLLQVRIVWAMLAKLTMHTLFFVQIARDANLLPSWVVALWIAFAGFLMCTEYYFIYVLWRISKKLLQKSAYSSNSNYSEVLVCFLTSYFHYAARQLVNN